jgi:hypothetical protein
MRFAFSLVFLVIGSSVHAQDILSPACAVTVPNEKRGPDQRSADSFGNAALSVWLGWTDGTVVFRPGGAGFVLLDGALSMKFGWERKIRGTLTIDGRRVDAEAPPLRARIPAGYGDIGFQATALIFPTPGCWEVTGRVGNANLTFVTKVVRVGPANAQPHSVLR